MRATFAITLLFCVCSCHRSAQLTPRTDAPGAGRIAVGDRLEDVSQRIVATGGRDWSQFIGIITYPRSRWFLLNDGTALEVQAAAVEGAGSEIVGTLTVGETGRGYANKEQWNRQRRREVQSLDL